MEGLQGQGFLNNLLNDLENAKSLTIISPYINNFAVEKIQEALKNNKGIKSSQFITLPIGTEYVTGAVQPESLLLLQAMGFELRSLKNLHAKLYLIDKSIIYIGSANFTYSGFVKNIEEMQRFRPSAKQIDHIQRRFVQPSTPLNINQETIEHLNNKYSDLKEHYENIIQLIEDQFESNDYEEFLQKIVSKRNIETFEHVEKNYGRMFIR
ncbi:phospholipase D-like domain-containing protein [Paenibacillus sp. tmac-D7]|uniref:phospholipase D-like domain-containing protein n=1 Tax=Paenibacillus sp. tmac-D7 TaxID=2591462 RepID=UPI001143F089|nr:phospholipase D-like domain-containing protein [Paenibacillus sp. tmac-D7]